MKSIAFVSDDKEQLRRALLFLESTERYKDVAVGCDRVIQPWHDCVVTWEDGSWGPHKLRDGRATTSRHTSLRSFMLAVIEDMPDEPEPIMWDGDPVLFNDGSVTLGSKQWATVDNGTILAIADRIREGQG